MTWGTKGYLEVPVALCPHSSHEDFTQSAQGAPEPLCLCLITHMDFSFLPENSPWP